MSKLAEKAATVFARAANQKMRHPGCKAQPIAVWHTTGRTWLVCLNAQIRLANTAYAETGDSLCRDKEKAGISSFQPFRANRCCRFLSKIFEMGLEVAPGCLNNFPRFISGT